jgi:prepilin-type processing-associated H-X9-DG protein
LALLLPALASAKDKARKVSCIANLHQIGVAIQSYAPDNGGRIPFGPMARTFASPLNLYPSTGAPTSLISLGDGAPVGLGLLLKHHLSEQRNSLFCPGSDQSVDAQTQLDYVGVRQAQCSYYYRHAGNTRVFDPPGAPIPMDHLKLDDLGTNRNGMALSALVIDTQFLCPPTVATFGISPSTHHRQRFANALYADTHVRSLANTDNRFTVNLNGLVNPYDSFDFILKVLEKADGLR